MSGLSGRLEQPRTNRMAVLVLMGAFLAACGGSTVSAPSVSAPAVWVGSCLTSRQVVEIVACDSVDAAIRVTQEASFDPALFASVDTLEPGESVYECPEGQEVIEINQRDFVDPSNGSYEGTWCVEAVDS